MRRTAHTSLTAADPAASASWACSPLSRARNPRRSQPIQAPTLRTRDRPGRYKRPRQRRIGPKRNATGRSARRRTSPSLRPIARTSPMAADRAVCASSAKEQLTPRSKRYAHQRIQHARRTPLRTTRRLREWRRRRRNRQRPIGPDRNATAVAARRCISPSMPRTAPTSPRAADLAGSASRKPASPQCAVAVKTG